jgi:hypothetical protein
MVKMAGNSGKDLGEAIGAIILGIVGGLALGAILEAINRPRCPVCQQQIQRGIDYCPNCHTLLRWN